MFRNAGGQLPGGENPGIFRDTGLCEPGLNCSTSTFLCERIRKSDGFVPKTTIIGDSMKTIVTYAVAAAALLAA